MFVWGYSVVLSQKFNAHAFFASLMVQVFLNYSSAMICKIIKFDTHALLLFLAILAL